MRSRNKFGFGGLVEHLFSKKMINSANAIAHQVRRFTTSVIRRSAHDPYDGVPGHVSNKFTRLYNNSMWLLDTTFNHGISYRTSRSAQKIDTYCYLDL